MMKRILVQGNIVESNADAIIYSTNVSLALSGGVGLALRERFGDRFQNDLWRASSLADGQRVNVGDVFETELEYTPWRVTFHSIATDAYYNTDPKNVSSIIQFCLSRLSNREGIKKIATSPIGTGYGHLSVEHFIGIIDPVLDGFENGSFEEFNVACINPNKYWILAESLRHSNKRWERH